GFRGYLISQLAIAFSHGAGRGNGSLFYNPDKFQRKIPLNILPKALGLGFWPGLGFHCSPLSSRFENINQVAHQAKWARSRRRLVLRRALGLLRSINRVGR